MTDPNAEHREAAEASAKIKCNFIRNLALLDLTGLQQQYLRIIEEDAHDTDHSLRALSVLADLVEAVAKYRFPTQWRRP